MTKLPDALFVIDPAKEATAVKEARRLKIPVIALLDTDCDPDQVNLPIPGNDDGIRAIQTVVKIIVDGIKEGRGQQVDRQEAPPCSRSCGSARGPLPTVSDCCCQRQQLRCSWRHPTPIHSLIPKR